MTTTPVSAPTAPAQPKAPAPPPQIYFHMTWDDGLLQRERSVKLDFNWLDQDKKVYRLDEAVTDVRGPGGRTTLDPSDRLQRTLALITMGNVLDNQKALRALESNVADNSERPAVRGGEFLLEIKGPMWDKPLVYMGVQKAMPAPIAQALDAAREMHRHY